MDEIKPTKEPDAAELMAEFLDGLPVGICRADAAGTILYCNRRFADIMKAEHPAALAGRTLHEFYQNAIDCTDMVGALGAGDTVEEEAMALQTCTGGPMWCWVSAGAVRDEAGDMAFIDTCIEKADSRSRSRSSAAKAVNDVPAAHGEAIIRLDLKGTIRGANQRALDLLGYAVEDFAGHRLHEFMPEGEEDALLWFLYEIMEKRRAEHVIPVRSRDGEVNALRLAAELVANGKDRWEINATAVNFSLTPAEREVYMQEQRFAGVKEMARSVSQILSQPLTVINLLMDQVEAGMKEDPKKQHKLVRMRHQIDQLNEIAKKIRGIKKYRAMDYVAGIRILDIDESS